MLNKCSFWHHHIFAAHATILKVQPCNIMGDACSRSCKGLYQRLNLQGLLVFFPRFPSVNQHGWLNNKSVSADLNSSTKFCDQVQTPSQTDTVVNMARNGTNRSPHIYIYSSNLFLISNLSIHMENVRTLIPNLRTTWQHQSYMHVAVIKFNPSHA